MFFFVKRLITLALDRSNREREMASQALSNLYADVSASKGKQGVHEGEWVREGEWGGRASEVHRPTCTRM